jgi:hypothetical protein
MIDLSPNTEDVSRISVTSNAINSVTEDSSEIVPLGLFDFIAVVLKK